MKVFKKLAAAGAAIMMAVTGMAMNVSALSWNLRYTPMAPSSDNLLLCDRTFTTNVVISEFYERCTSYENTMKDGIMSKAEYWAYSINSSGDVRYGMGVYNHYGVNSSINTYVLNKNCPVGYTLHVKYRLVSNGNRTVIGGTVSI